MRESNKSQVRVSVRHGTIAISAWESGITIRINHDVAEIEIFAANYLLEQLEQGIAVGFEFCDGNFASYIDSSGESVITIGRRIVPVSKIERIAIGRGLRAALRIAGLTARRTEEWEAKNC